MNSQIAIAVICGALLVLTLGGTRAAYATPPQPCSLLTQAQVSTTLGIAVVAGKPEGQFDCECDQPGWSMIRGVRLLLHVLGTVGNLSPVQQFNTIKMPLPVFLPHSQEIIKTPLSGVGDDAVYVIRGNSAPELTVKKGDSVFQVRIQGFPSKQVSQVNQIEAKEKTLALDVLAKL
jgi:hypothetical protein